VAAKKETRETLREREELFERETAHGAYNVSVPNFEGPLDLLLHLIQKHELEIMDIPISFITKKYLEYLQVMTLLNLDIASDYLVMAATLAHIKSKMLLPQVPEGQEDGIDGEELDPREALIRRLLEYQRYKQASVDLAQRGTTGVDVFLRGSDIEQATSPVQAPLAEIPLFSLIEAFSRVISKSKVKFTHDIVADRIGINDRIHEIVDVLRLKKSTPFEDLFSGLVTRFDLVITFLALLEMGKLRLLRLYQTDPLAPLHVEYTGSADGPLDLSNTQISADGGTDAPAIPPLRRRAAAGDDEEEEEADLPEVLLPEDDAETDGDPSSVRERQPDGGTEV